MNTPDKLPKFSRESMFRMQMGNEVGQLAKTLYPKGIDIPEQPFKENLRLTEIELLQRNILFEPGIIVDDMFARADILIPVEKDEWDLVEVKSSTKPKDDHIHDLTFQKYVYEKAGLKIRNCFLMHLNNEFVKEGPIDPEQLLISTDLTKEVNKESAHVQEKIRHLREIEALPQAPLVQNGAICTNGMKLCNAPSCWAFLPESNVFELYRGGKKSYELMEAEVLDLKDIPDDFALNDKQQIQKKCARENKPFINKTNIKKFLDKLQYPLYYLDFETFATAIPIYEETKPYQNIPFQFSVVIDDGKTQTHKEFLHDSKEDPRKPFLEHLRDALGEKGSIIVYNESFERNIIKKTAEFLPIFEQWAEQIDERIIDLLKPFRDFDYYSPEQKGSCSIKAVLPALTKKDYSHLDIADGGTASVSFYESVFGGLSEDQVRKVREDLLKYCKLDTEGMVWIVDALIECLKK